MRYPVSGTPALGDQMLGSAAPAGTVAALLTLGIASCIGLSLAWISRQRLGANADMRCSAAAEFAHQVTPIMERLSSELECASPGLGAPLREGLLGIWEREMWFSEENYRRYVLAARGRTATDVARSIGQWLCEPLRKAIAETRRHAGRRLYSPHQAADRKRLNERIGQLEAELSRCARSHLKIDLSRLCNS